MWLDSHCHLTADRFDEDRAEVLHRADLARVDTLVAIGSGYGVHGNTEAIALAEARDGIFATAGIHPHEASELDDTVRGSLRSWLAHPKVVAVGECGLDYHYMNSPRDAQLRAFGEQVALARELDLPVTIHVRSDDASAYEDLLSIWLDAGGGELEGVLHCYTGSLDFARRGVEAGLYVSFSGIVTFKKSHELRDVVRGLPLDRLMVETDAPFLAPQGHRGRRNEPAFLPRVGETLAELRGLPLDEVARITSANARRLFRLPE